MREARSENVFCSESISYNGDGYSWHVECVTHLNDGTWGPYNETAGGFTDTKWGARRRIRRWRKQLTRDALAALQLHEQISEQVGGLSG